MNNFDVFRYSDCSDILVLIKNLIINGSVQIRNRFLIFLGLPKNLKIFLAIKFTENPWSY
tara:strand:+ start:1174 stop:1353 length:180 start_codon:yes stop_codon:yes gene_type:complete